MSDYYKGERVRCKAFFRDADDLDVPVDPTNVTFKFRINGGSATTYTYGSGTQVIKDATGAYHVDLDLTSAGTWETQFASTGSFKALSQDSFSVLDSF